MVYKHPNLLGHLGEIHLHRGAITSFQCLAIPQHQDSVALAQRDIGLAFPVDCFQGDPNVPRRFAFHLHLGTTQKMLYIRNSYTKLVSLRLGVNQK